MTEYSAIIPAFNRAYALPRAIASVLAQSRPAKEIIVVDDASTDGTAETLAQLAARSLRVVRHAQNLGPAAARNTGAEIARTPWIAFLDSDDEWAPAKAQQQLTALLGVTGASRASVTGYAVHDPRNGRNAVFKPVAETIAPQSLLFGCPFSTGTTLMVEREAFVATGGFDPALRRLEDWDWVMRYQRRYTLAGLPEVLATINKSTDPSYANVAGAVARLRELHSPVWQQTSVLAARKFESTLNVEEAAGAYFAGDHRRATALTLRAIAAYPFRGIGFYAMLARRSMRTSRR